MDFNTGDIRFYMEKRTLEGYVFGKAPSKPPPQYTQLTLEEVKNKRKCTKHL